MLLACLLSAWHTNARVESTDGAAPGSHTSSSSSTSATATDTAGANAAAGLGTDTAEAEAEAAGTACLAARSEETGRDDDAVGSAEATAAAAGAGGLGRIAAALSTSTSAAFLPLDDDILCESRANSTRRSAGRTARARNQNGEAVGAQRRHLTCADHPATVIFGAADLEVGATQSTERDGALRGIDPASGSEWERKEEEKGGESQSICPHVFVRLKNRRFATKKFWKFSLPTGSPTDVLTPAHRLVWPLPRLATHRQFFLSPKSPWPYVKRPPLAHRVPCLCNCLFHGCSASWFCVGVFFTVV